jgi:predicted RNA binding protein YcfA (HicA-like mRNA interferase family)
MPGLPSLKSNEVLQALIKAGFYIRRQKGSHARLFHRQRTDLKITVPVHNKDIPENTLKRRLTQAGLTTEDFIKLLNK